MTDNKNVLRVLHGYLELSSQEKQILSREIEKQIREGVVYSDYMNGAAKNRVKVILSANLGPMSNNNCKCCGKG